MKHDDTTQPSNEGPAAELAEPYSPRLGLGEAVARLVHEWRGTTYTESADADGTPNPERRDEAGNVPTAITNPSEPFDASDIGGTPSALEPVVFVLGKPVELTRATSWTTAMQTATTVARQLVGANPKRRRLTITNDGGAGDVFIAPSREEVEATTSRKPIKDTGSVELLHTDEVWIIAGADLSVSLVLEQDR